MDFMEKHKVVNCFNSVQMAAFEDMYNGSPAGDIINMQDWRQCYFIIHRGAGAAGTATLTVESCDTVVPGTATAIPFMSRTMTTATDTWSAWVQRTAAGYTTTAGANTAEEIMVRAEDLHSTDKYVRLQCTEVDGTANDGGIVAILTDPRYAEDVNRTVLV
jgi:hypothetical protein